MPARLRGHVVRVGRGRHRLMARRDPELDQGKLLGLGRPDLTAGHQRALERTRLGMSEQVRPHDPEPVQVGLHRLGAGPGVRRQGDAEEHEIGVRIGVGLDPVPAVDPEQPQPLERRDRARDGFDLPSTSRIPGEAQERAGERGSAGAGGRLVFEQEPRGLEQPRAPGHGSEPRCRGPEIQGFSGRAFYIGAGHQTVRARIADAMASAPRKAQLHRVAEQVGSSGEHLRRDRGEARAIHGGEVGGPEPEPAAGSVPGSEVDDHPETREDPHGIAAGPIRGGDPEVAEDLGRGSAAVEDRVALDGGAEHDERAPGDSGAPDPGRDLGPGEPQVLVQGRGRAGPWLLDLDRRRDPGPDRVGAWDPRCSLRPSAPGGRCGLVNRGGGCYVLVQNVLVSRRRRSGCQSGGRVSALPPFAFGSDDDATGGGGSRQPRPRVRPIHHLQTAAL